MSGRQRSDEELGELARNLPDGEPDPSDSAAMRRSVLFAIGRARRRRALAWRAGAIAACAVAGVLAAVAIEGWRPGQDEGARRLVARVTRIEQRTGRTTYDIAPRGRGERLLVVTPHAEVEVRGTRFTVSVESSSTDVEVVHGRVEVRDRQGEVRGVLGAGQRTRVATRLRVASVADPTPVQPPEPPPAAMPLDPAPAAAIRAGVTPRAPSAAETHAAPAPPPVAPPPAAPRRLVQSSGPSRAVEAARDPRRADDEYPSIFGGGATTETGSDRPIRRRERALHQSPRSNAELAAFRTAHELHFGRNDFAAALEAWNRYLAAYPRGSLAQDARYNRAVCLLRLGRAADADSDLSAISGAPGAFRAREARLLRGAALASEGRCDEANLLLGPLAEGSDEVARRAAALPPCRSTAER
ncbi:MAG: FecR domain-containing protein [Deltaproteobacteria bacterium]|nr:FecR domain-containing protein [Deltaproteobacteria bacterium]